MEIHKELTVLKLLHTKKISPLAFRVCQDLNVKNLKSLLAYHNRYANFFASGFCIKKINQELHTFCRQMVSKPDSFFSARQFIPIAENIFKNKRQLKKIDFYVNSLFDELDPRFRKTLLRSTEKIKVDFKWMYNLFSLYTGMILMPSALGEKTEMALLALVKDGMKMAIKVSKEKLTDFDMQMLDLYEHTGIDFSEKLKKEKRFKSGSFDIFEFIWAFYPQLFSLSALDEVILLNCLKLEKKSYTLQQIAKQHGITHERVRQRRNNLFKLVDGKVDILHKLIPGNLILQKFPQKSFIEIDENILKKVSPTFKLKKVPLNFAAFILFLLFKDRFFLLGPTIKLNRPKQIYDFDFYELHKTFQNSYLIDRRIFNENELLSIINKTIVIKSARRVSSFNLLLKDLDQSLLFPKKEAVLKQILNAEFGIHIRNHHIVFEKNRNTLNSDIIFHALKTIGEPAHLSKIIKEIKKENKSIRLSENSIRYFMTNGKDKFIFFGRSSTYGLKEWENKKGNIKGGTIRELVIQFLQKKPGEIIHIDEIANYVIQFRDTSPSKILANLKLDAKGRFLFPSVKQVCLAEN